MSGAMLRRLRRGIAAAAVLVVALATTAAAAQPAAGDSATTITNTALHYTITLSPAWRAAAASPPLVAAFGREDTGQTLALVQVRYPTRPAWQGKRRFFAEVEAGAVGGTDARHLRRHRFKVHGVPVMDLRFSRRTDAGRQAVAMRFLFYRRYTLAVAIATPWRARGARRQARRVVASFRPYFAAAGAD